MSELSRNNNNYNMFCEDGSISLTFVVEILQISADVDADVLHFHVFETGKLVHVLQQSVIFASPCTCEDVG